VSLTLTLRQRALVSDRLREDFLQTTFQHLPGTVVRGAFAAAWLAEHGGTADSNRLEFLLLFEGGVRFGPLFRGGPPTPLSIVSHKYRIGTGDKECADLDFDQALTGLARPYCPTCEVPLEPAKGMRGEKATVSRRTSVAINEAGVARRGQIVTRDTLDPEQAFRGSLVADDPALLDRLAALGPVRVGGRRTTHGTAEVALDAVPPELPERLADGRVVLRLRSPGIFVDDYGRPSRDPNLAELSDVLGSRVEVHGRWFRWVTIGGWHAASNLPKPAELAVAAGSTYVISASGGIGDGGLTALAERGIGLRRCEGFGDLGGPFPLEQGARGRSEEGRRTAKAAEALAKRVGISLNGKDWAQCQGPLTSYVRGEISAADLVGRLLFVPLRVQSNMRKLPQRYDASGMEVNGKWRR